VYINWKRKELIITLAVYGPQGSGKTTTWRHLSEGALAPPTEDEDSYSLHLHNVQGKQVVLNVRDICGAEGEAARRRVALYGADGLIFVADSCADRQEANRRSLDELQAHLGAMNKSLQQVPVILQYNKRDLPDAVAVHEMQDVLNPKRRLHYQETCALHEEGLVELLKQATDLVLVAVLH
jgi:hypothetical protein